MHTGFALFCAFSYHLAALAMLGAATTTSLDVIVVGAGAAGLAAAQTLQQLGFKAVCLEARSRAGGRVPSVSAVLCFSSTCRVGQLGCRAI